MIVDRIDGIASERFQTRGNSTKYTDNDAEKGYVTEYASDRPDKTDLVWDWLFSDVAGRKSYGKCRVILTAGVFSCRTHNANRARTT